MTPVAATTHTAAGLTDTGAFFRALQAARCQAAAGAARIDALSVLARFALSRGPFAARAEQALREVLPGAKIGGAPVVTCASGAVVDTATGEIIGYDHRARP